MKKFRVWVLTDKRGVVMRYTTGHVVIYPTRREAQVNGNAFDPKRQWRATRAEVTVSGDA